MEKYCNQCGRPLHPDKVCICKDAEEKNIEENSKKTDTDGLSVANRPGYREHIPGVDKLNIDYIGRDNTTEYEIDINVNDFKTGEINIQYTRGASLKKYIQDDMNSGSEVNENISNEYKVNEYKVNEYKVNEYKVNEERLDKKKAYICNTGEAEQELFDGLDREDIRKKDSDKGLIDHDIDLHGGQFMNEENQEVYAAHTNGAGSSDPYVDINGNHIDVDVTDSIAIFDDYSIGNADVSNKTREIKSKEESVTTGASKNSAVSGNLTASGSPQASKSEGESKKHIIVKSMKGMIAYCKNFLSLFINTFKDPANSLAEYAKSGDTRVAVTYIGIESVLFALFLVSIFGKFNNLIARELGGLLSMLQLSGYDESFPIKRIFIVSLVLSLSFHALLAGLLLFLHKVMLKVVYSYKRMLRVVSVRAVVLIPVLLAATVISIFSIGIGIFIYFIAGILTYYLIGEALHKSREIDANKAIYVLFFAVAITITIIFIALFLGYELYLPDRIMTTWWE